MSDSHEANFLIARACNSERLLAYNFYKYSPTQCLCKWIRLHYANVVRANLTAGVLRLSDFVASSFKLIKSLMDIERWLIVGGMIYIISKTNFHVNMCNTLASNHFLSNSKIKTTNFMCQVFNIKTIVGLHMKNQETETTFTHDPSELTHFPDEGKFAENVFVSRKLADLFSVAFEVFSVVANRTE